MSKTPPFNESPEGADEKPLSRNPETDPAFRDMLNEPLRRESRTGPASPPMDYTKAMRIAQAKIILAGREAFAHDNDRHARRTHQPGPMTWSPPGHKSIRVLPEMNWVVCAACSTKHEQAPPPDDGSPAPQELAVGAVITAISFNLILCPACANSLAEQILNIAPPMYDVPGAA